MKLKSLFTQISFTSGIWLIVSTFWLQKPVNSQIIPDQTLGQENTKIRNVERFKKQIEGGAIRGSNLFHSLQEFNIQKNQSVYFTNPIGIENILTRITGNNPSNILGKLGVDGVANLFLVNPNGIFFGPNSTLDIRGSFIATTADEIQLGENGRFSSTNPQNTNLLSVAPSALFFNQITNYRGNITNQSAVTGLEIPTGKTLGLVGNNVIIDGGKLSAEQGRIEIGSVDNQSLIQLENTENNYIFDYSEVKKFNNIQLKNNAIVDASGEGSGTIQIQAKQIQITEKSTILANTLGTQPGNNVSLTATESIEVNDSLVDANVEPGATGNGATITIETPTLTLTNGGQISTATFYAGTSGELTVNAKEIVIIGASSDGQNLSGLFTDVLPGAKGKGGDVTINTQKLQLFNGGQIGANVSGAGQGGNLTVNAEEIEARGTIPGSSPIPEQQLILQILNDQYPSAILAIVVPDATGNSGKLTIDSDRILLEDGAQIGTGTFGLGNSGELKIKATDITIKGTFEDGPSSFFTSVFGTGGKGGDLIIETQSLNLENGGQIRAGTSGVGNSGNIKITATEINLQGSSGNRPFPSSIQVSVEDLFNLFPESVSSGNGGNLNIETGRLHLSNGAQIRAGTSGKGKGGNLTIIAKDIELDGGDDRGVLSTSILAGVEDLTIFSIGQGQADGGNTLIQTERLTILDGAKVSTTTEGSGRAGNLTINATDNVTLSGVNSVFGNKSAITASSELGATGAGGNINISTPTLSLSNDAVITVSSSGSEAAGALSINASSIELNNGTLSAETTAGNRGNISIQGSKINLQNQSQITTNATNTATGGNIQIESKFLISSDGSNISANAIEGQGGNIFISGEGVFLDNSSQITATSDLGIDGSVELNTQVDPTQGIVKLSTTVIDVESLVANNLCRATTEGSSFVITGKGGLPPDPTQPLTILRGIVEWETNTPEDIGISHYQKPVVVYRRQENQQLPEIRQAMGWVINESGQVTLTSTPNNVNSVSPQLIHPECYLFF
ncbi:filamentous hemagglutinin N-terminal domain-containing protein [Okeania sp.]|uniref:two-partner secretion domain-containing protein n=1 Tax=Okeania sp. TaxID=3100323 RepID=UPI002B4AC5DE|nr:filamentous hemagglutinin N-terminal domain-containing protein [Okeania sp.]MEB3339239.1 filamentous hemagglutinin N-terminal domain-containing protein [Okeania sp.]